MTNSWARCGLERTHTVDVASVEGHIASQGMVLVYLLCFMFSLEHPIAWPQKPVPYTGHLYKV